MDPLGSPRIGKGARYDSFNFPHHFSDPNYHPHCHPPFTPMPNLPMAAPPHRIIPGDHHKQHWQSGDRHPSNNPYYIPAPLHPILTGFDTYRISRVSTRCLISDDQINNGLSLGGPFMPENCERGRDGDVDNHVVSCQSSDRFPPYRKSSFPSRDPSSALVSCRSFELEQDRFLKEWRYQRRLGLWDTRVSSFRDPSVEQLAFESSSLVAEPPSFSSPRGLCGADSVSCWGGDGSTSFEPGLSSLSSRFSGHCFYGGEIVECADTIENSRVIGNGLVPQWAKPMCSKRSSAGDVPTGQGFPQRQYLGHRAIIKSDPMSFSAEDRIRWAHNTQRKALNLRSLVDDCGFGDDGSINSKRKRKMASDRNAKFLSRCAKPPIQKPIAFSRIQSGISVWERLEKKSLGKSLIPSPFCSPNTVSSPRNSNENQAKVDMLDLPFKSEALVAKGLDPLTAEPRLKTNRVVKKKKKGVNRRKKEVISILPTSLESSKKQLIQNVSSLCSPTNSSMQSEAPIKAATPCCLSGANSVHSCYTKQVKELEIVNRTEAKEELDAVIQLEGGITRTPVVEDDTANPKCEDGANNLRETICKFNVVLGSEPIDDSNLQLCQQGKMMQMTIANGVSTHGITKKVNQEQDLAIEILDDSVGLEVRQKSRNRYECPVVSEALVSANFFSQSCDPVLPLIELPVDYDTTHGCSPNVGNTDAANSIEQVKTEMAGIVTFTHFKTGKEIPLQKAASPKPLGCGDAEASAAPRSCDDLPEFNSPQGITETKVKQQRQLLACKTAEHLEVLGVDVSSQPCSQGLQSHSTSEISNSILKEDFSNEVNVEENNEFHFSGCNLLPQSCCDGAFPDNLVIDASAKRIGQSLALESRKIDSPFRHFENPNKCEPKSSESGDFNNCIFYSQEDQKHDDKEDDLVSAVVSLASELDQLGKSMRHNQLMSNKTKPLLSQELKKKVTSTKLADDNFSLKSMPTRGMVPRFLHSRKNFTGLVKNAAQTNQTGRHRTWVRTNKPSFNLDANLKQPGGTSNKRLSEKLCKMQNSSYIRKGNSLIRKQDDPPSTLLPAIDASSITFKSNTESSVCKSRLECSENAASSYPFVERPKTPPLPLSKFSSSSMNTNDSFPQHKSVDERPELSIGQMKQNHSHYEDLHSCNLESHVVECYAGVETINPKRIIHVKCKMNQSIVAPELQIDKSSKFPTETSQIPVQHSEERSKAMPVSSSHIYYRRKRNQLVLNVSSSDYQEAGAPVDNSNSVDYFKQKSKFSLKSKIAIQKEKNAGKTSLVWMLGGVRSSQKQKIFGTLHRQGVLPFILPWKRPVKRNSLLISNGPVSRRFSLSLISQKLQHLRKRNTIYKVSTDGFSIQKAGVVSIGGSNLKWSKSIEKRSKKASEEATMAVAEVERKKRERKKRKGTCNRKSNVGLPCSSNSSSVLKQDDNTASLATQQTGNKNQMPSVPRRLVNGNDEYIRIGSGNQLVRDLKNKLKRIIASEKVRWSLHTARLRLAQKRQYCLFFTRFGKCKYVGGRCPFIHDTSKIAICSKFLKGQCSDANCKLTHKIIPERMQDCSYFLKGFCIIENCPYRHVKVNANAPLCGGFLRGHCDDGDKCHKKHSYTCPIFEATGKCPQGYLCKLHHPKAHGKSRKRQRTDLQSTSQGRYFCSSVDNTGEPMRVVSGEVLKGLDDIFFSDGRFTEYISLDVYGDTSCIENKTPMELHSRPLDSGYADLKSSDFDELLKPVRIMNTEDLTIF